MTVRDSSLFFVAMALLFATASAVAAEPAFRVVEAPEGSELILRAGVFDSNTKIAARPQILNKTAEKTASFEVIYNGFTPEAEAAFQQAVDIWGALITSSQTIRVEANFMSLEPGVLGSARSNTFWVDTLTNDVFPDALADALTGSDLGGGDFDIVANFNSDNPNWYFGTDGNPPSGQFDMVTVVLHEIGHGLGFLGGLFVDGGLGRTGFVLSDGTPAQAIYDQFTEDEAGVSLIDRDVYPDPSVVLANALQSGAVFFDGPNARGANGGQRPELFAPSTWVNGSSYSHLDEAVYPPGDRDSLMTPALGPAEAIHDPGAITLCMFQDMGWVTAEDCATTCLASDTSVCLQDNRFQVSIDWRGSAPPFDTLRPAFASNLGTEDSGIFYFVDPANLELLIKVIDACDTPFNSFWVFFAATTDVEFTVTVTDTRTDAVRQYTNELGNPANAITDTAAFATCP